MLEFYSKGIIGTKMVDNSCSRGKNLGEKRRVEQWVFMLSYAKLLNCTGEAWGTKLIKAESESIFQLICNVEEVETRAEYLRCAWNPGNTLDSKFDNWRAMQ